MNVTIVPVAPPHETGFGAIIATDADERYGLELINAAAGDFIRAIRLGNRSPITKGDDDAIEGREFIIAAAKWAKATALWPTSAEPSVLPVWLSPPEPAQLDSLADGLRSALHALRVYSVATLGCQDTSGITGAAADAIERAISQTKLLADHLRGKAVTK